MGDQYLGEIRLVAFKFAPVGWALCNGQLLSITSNSALFALLGITYGGNGSTNFALPNLQSRVVVATGQGQGLSGYTLGQMGGAESNTLALNNVPAHFHTVSLQGSSGNGSQPNPGGAIFAATTDATGTQYDSYTTNKADSTMAPQNTSTVGSSLPVPNLQPYLALNYIIAIQGIYPTQN